MTTIIHMSETYEAADSTQQEQLIKQNVLPLYAETLNWIPWTYKNNSSNITQFFVFSLFKYNIKSVKLNNIAFQRQFSEYGIKK